MKILKSGREREPQSVRFRALSQQKDRRLIGGDGMGYAAVLIVTDIDFRENTCAAIDTKPRRLAAALRFDPLSVIVLHSTMTAHAAPSADRPLCTALLSIAVPRDGRAGHLPQWLDSDQRNGQCVCPQSERPVRLLLRRYSR